MDFQEIYNAAHAAGHKAATEFNPIPMVVQQRANPLDDSSRIVYQERVDDGVCGFAWVNFKGNTAWARWTKSNDIGRRDEYYGGRTLWVSDYGQSYQRKTAYARAFVDVLRANGIDAHYDGRLD